MGEKGILGQPPSVMASKMRRTMLDRTLVWWTRSSRYQRFSMIVAAFLCVSHATLIIILNYFISR
jgi:hypothetical protein